MKTYMSHLQIKGFKSFNKPTRIEFTPGLNCVVGPNGSGKSNVLDALCFTLGRLSTKSIRAENYGDLLHKKKGQQAQIGEVALRLDNSSQVFPVESKILELTRKINKQGQTVYYLNGRRATRQQAVDMLSMSKITPDGHNIILQGDIDKFISMSAIDKRKVLEEVAGIYVYESKKEAAMRELGKVDKKLDEARIVLNEKQAYMGSLENEKKEAEKYLSFENELKASKATGFRLRMSAINSKRSEISQRFSKIEDVHNKFKKQIDEREKRADAVNERIKKVEDKIEKKGGEEQLNIQKTIENLRVGIENSKNLITSSKNDINRIRERKKGLESQLGEIITKLRLKEKERDELEKQKRTLIGREQLITKDVSSAARSVEDMEIELEKKNSLVDELKTRKEKTTAEIQKFTASLEVLNYKFQDIQEKLNEIEAQKQRVGEVKKGKDRYKNIIQETNKLQTLSTDLQKEIQELRGRVVQREDELGRLRADVNSSQELIMRDRAVSIVMKNKSKLGGILGTISQLGRVDSRYAKALSVAAGYKMKNVVVDSDDVAIKALSLLKQTKAGVATFLPLTKIKVRTTAPHVQFALSNRGVIGLASDLITCDAKYKPIFRHIFRDTLIVQDSPTAKSLGIGKLSMVTLDGDVFSTSGAITGGFRSQRSGLKFAEKDGGAQLDNLVEEVQLLKKELTRKEKERTELDDKIIELRKEKGELEGGLGIVKVGDPSELQTRKANFVAKIKAQTKQKEDFEKDMLSIGQKINRAIVEKNSLSSKLKDIKFGKKSQELKEIESRKKSVEAKLASLIATIENALAPEKNNIQRVITSLDKEQSQFEAQIHNEHKEIETDKNKLVIREREEKEFYGSLKNLFAEKNKFMEVLRKEEEEVKKLQNTLAEDNEERNAMQIAKAKIDAQYSALQEEIEPFKDCKSLPYLKNPSQAKEKQKEMETRLEELGSVNMRALEIYDKAKKDFDQIFWRVEKLTKEKTSIVDVVNEIEKRKRETFVSTFEGISKNFSRIFERISDKMRAQLLMEDKENPFDGGLHIRIHKEGHDKSLYVGSLSGGEKTLVALSFIFAVQEHDPAPFYLLDEIDAALDKINSEKVAALLQEYSKKAQVVIISHNDAIISAADNLYGVWMDKNGESSINALKI